MSERLSIDVRAWFADLSDRGIQAGLVPVAGAAAGFGILGLTWSGVAAKLFVSLQLPYVVSGGFGGLALAGFCLAIAAVHYERRTSASDRVELDDAIDIVSEIAELLPVRMARRPALVTNGRTLHRPDCRMVAGRGLPRWSAGQDDEELKDCRVCRPRTRA